jgi:LPXTG-site transpeptidase (sortase) family protein
VRIRESPGAGSAAPGLLSRARGAVSARGVTVARRLFTAIAALCLGAWVAVTGWAHYRQEENRARLARMLEVGDAGVRLREAGRALVPGTLLGRVDIPRVHVSTVILEGTGPRWLAQAAGHMPGTALPGEDGNAVIAGHRDGLFRGLREIRPGDAITITTPAVTRTYIVDSTEVVDPHDMRILSSRGEPELTLITCFPFTYIGPAPERFVVHALGLPRDRHELRRSAPGRERPAPVTRASGRREPVRGPLTPLGWRGTDRIRTAIETKL